jgi:chemotaxis response regulator CheB
VISAADREGVLHLARSDAPDLILPDMLVPKMTGLGMLRNLRADEGTRAVPVLVLSTGGRDAGCRGVSGEGEPVAAGALRSSDCDPVRQGQWLTEVGEASSPRTTGSCCKRSCRPSVG